MNMKEINQKILAHRFILEINLPQMPLDLDQDLRKNQDLNINKERLSEIKMDQLVSNLSS